MSAEQVSTHAIANVPRVTREVNPRVASEHGLNVVGIHLEASIQHFGLTNQMIWTKKRPHRTKGS